MYTRITVDNSASRFEQARDSRDSHVITLVAPFSAWPLKAHLEACFSDMGSSYEVVLSACNSGLHYVLDQERGLPRHPAGIHVLLFRFEDWDHVANLTTECQGVHPASREMIERKLRQLIQGLDDAAEACFNAVLLVACPPSPKYRNNKAALRYFADAELRLRQALSGSPRFAAINAMSVLDDKPDAITDTDDAEPVYPNYFWEMLARKIIRACYAIESRPWKGVVLSAESAAAIDPMTLRSFVQTQWLRGRSVALAGPAKSVLSTEDYAAWDFRSVKPFEHLQYLSKTLFVPVHDLMFLSGREECEQAQAQLPGILALPVMQNPGQFYQFVDELWCLDPVVESWISEPDLMTPTLPRLSGRLLTALACNPKISIPAALRAARRHDKCQLKKATAWWSSGASLIRIFAGWDRRSPQIARSRM